MTSPTYTPLDAETLEMLTGSIRHVLTEQSDRSLAVRLAELGWDEVVEQDAPNALRMLFAIKGETLSPADALGPELAAALADATGEPDLRTCSVGLASPFAATRRTDIGLAVDTIACSAIDAAQIAVLTGDAIAVCPTEALTAEPVAGFDTDLGLVRVMGEVADGAILWVDAAATESVVARGRWLLASELAGIGHHVTTTVVEYTKQRVQYGKPIGVFQALQHRLAGAYAMVVGAGHLTAEAAVSGDPWAAMVAKCMAGIAAEHACTQAQQCYGAIGFTWEHEFHRYLRRTYTLDRLLGDWRSLEHEIGARLQQTGVVPRIGHL